MLQLLFLLLPLRSAVMLLWHAWMLLRLSWRCVPYSLL